MALITKREEEDAELVELTTEAARELIDFDLGDVMTEAIDKAQARVFGGDAKTAVVVIRIQG